MRLVAPQCIAALQKFRRIVRTPQCIAALQKFRRIVRTPPCIAALQKFRRMFEHRHALRRYRNSAELFEHRHALRRYRNFAKCSNTAMHCGATEIPQNVRKRAMYGPLQDNEAAGTVSFLCLYGVRAPVFLTMFRLSA
ncbi:MAG: hypothetical protein KA821_01930 [Chitinophagaceae bacterium]|nr:hypothetical protein [Chitinophagaceae bacterium]